MSLRRSKYPKNRGWNPIRFGLLEYVGVSALALSGVAFVNVAVNGGFAVAPGTQIVPAIMGQAEAAAPEAPAISGMAHVVDGATLEINGQRIRLQGIDAPEVGQMCADEPGGRQAQAALQQMIAAKSVACTDHGRDADGRMVGVCTAGSADLNADMVENGWAGATIYSASTYGALETQAREAQRGLWPLNCEAPWDYRAEHRGD